MCSRYGIKLTNVAVLLILFFSPLITYAQEGTRQEEDFQSSWEFTNLLPSITFSQIYLDNWQKGGDDSFTYTAIFDNDFSRKGDWLNWDNKVDLKIGQTKAGKSGSQVTINEIRIRSDLVYKQRKRINPFFGGSFKTQVTRGFDYDETPKEPLSDFGDPFELTYRLGLDFNFAEDLTFRLSADFIELKGNNFLKIEKAGDEISINRFSSRKLSSYVKFNKSFMDDSFDIKTELDIKTDLKQSSNSLIAWENIVTFKLIKFINFSLIANYLYLSMNEDIKKGSKKGQLRLITGLTLGYDFKELLKDK